MRFWGSSVQLEKDNSFCVALKIENKDNKHNLVLIARADIVWCHFRGSYYPVIAFCQVSIGTGK